MNIAHQGDIIFMTMFLYGSDGRARWYSASSMASAGGTNPFRFTGDLYETTGPFFGGSFNPNAVGIRRVGTAILDAPYINAATLTYSADGVTVQKSIQRNTFRNANLSGNYIGAIRGTVSGCASGNGLGEEAALFTVNHNSATGQFSVVASTYSGLTCTYTGVYTQTGRMGAFVGTSRCSNGSVSNVNGFEIEASYYSFAMRYSAAYGGSCQEVGKIAALKRD